MKKIKTAWKTLELRRKLILVAFVLLVFRLGNHIPVPFIDVAALKLFFEGAGNNILGLMNVMSGGAYSTATVFALSVQPYINASIIVQLLTVAIPALEHLQRDGGDAGRKRIEQITRYMTLALGLLQGFGYYMLIRYNGFLANESVWAATVIILAFTAGSVFIMWLGEQITEAKIVGNGISVLLLASIVSRLPNALYYMYSGVSNWVKKVDDAAILLHPGFVPVIVLGMGFMMIAIVFVTISERRIPVRYAKRVGNARLQKVFPSTLPLKVNMSGVMPIIFAQTLLSIPGTIAAFVPKVQNSAWIKAFDSHAVLYNVLYAGLILTFSYFYASIQSNPVEMANNLKKQGGFIPGVRSGAPTADYLSHAIRWLTLFGAIYLSIIAILPNISGAIFGVAALSIGGTSVLIVVASALEIEKSMESQIFMENYKGFLP